MPGGTVADKREIKAMLVQLHRHPNDGQNIEALCQAYLQAGAAQRSSIRQIIQQQAHFLAIFDPQTGYSGPDLSTQPLRWLLTKLAQYSVTDSFADADDAALHLANVWQQAEDNGIDPAFYFQKVAELSTDRDNGARTLLRAVSDPEARAYYLSATTPAADDIGFVDDTSEQDDAPFDLLGDDDLLDGLFEDDPSAADADFDFLGDADEDAPTAVETDARPIADASGDGYMDDFGFIAEDATEQAEDDGSYVDELGYMVLDDGLYAKGDSDSSNTWEADAEPDSANTTAHEPEDAFAALLTDSDLSNWQSDAVASADAGDDFSDFFGSDDPQPAAQADDPFEDVFGADDPQPAQQNDDFSDFFGADDPQPAAQADADDPFTEIFGMDTDASTDEPEDAFAKLLEDSELGNWQDETPASDSSGSFGALFNDSDDDALPWQTTDAQQVPEASDDFNAFLSNDDDAMPWQTADEQQVPEASDDFGAFLSDDDDAPPWQNADDQQANARDEGDNWADDFSFSDAAQDEPADEFEALLADMDFGDADSDEPESQQPTADGPLNLDYLFSDIGNNELPDDDASPPADMDSDSNINLSASAFNMDPQMLGALVDEAKNEKQQRRVERFQQQADEFPTADFDSGEFDDILQEMQYHDEVANANTTDMGMDEFDAILNDMDVDDLADDLFGNQADAAAGDTPGQPRTLSEALMQDDPSLMTRVDGAQKAFQQGREMAAQGNFAEANRLFTEAISLDPAFEAAFLFRAQLRAQSGGEAGALADYTQVLMLNPQNAQAYLARAQLYVMREQAQSAFHDFEEALQLEPNLCDAYRERARLYVNGEAYEEALADLDAAIECHEEDADAYYLRGRVLHSMGQTEYALSDYDRAIELDESQAGAYFQRGSLEREAGNMEAAIKDFRAAHKIEPHNSALLLAMAQTYETTKDFVRALQFYAQYLSDTPDLPKAERKAIEKQIKQLQKTTKKN